MTDTRSAARTQAAAHFDQHNLVLYPTRRSDEWLAVPVDDTARFGLADHRGVIVTVHEDGTATLRPDTNWGMPSGASDQALSLAAGDRFTVRLAVQP